MDMNAIGQRIKMAREVAHITQEELARTVGCTPQHISAIERGIKTPKLETFISIANAVGSSSDLLLQDVLKKPVDSIASEFSAAVAPLSLNMQMRIIRALRVFALNEE